MKRILVLMLCVILLCALPVAVFAEDVDFHTEEAADTEFTTDQIADFVKENFEGLSVLISLFIYAFYRVKKDTSMGKSVGTLNNNAVAIAENSKAVIDKALAGVSGASTIVTEYIGKMDNLLAEIRTNEEDKKAMKAALDTAMKYVESAKDANVELANELAELLILANIPNAKKEELYARHRAAVEAIKALGNAEVKTDEETEE